MPFADVQGPMPPEQPSTPPSPHPQPPRRVDLLDQAQPTAAARPFLQVYFVCANAYQRVFRAADQSQYLARCPKCGKQMRFQVGPDGTNQRTFQVTCQ